jgi:hypothetical protein
MTGARKETERSFMPVNLAAAFDGMVYLGETTRARPLQREKH